MINKIKNILTVFLLALSLFLPEAPILGQSTQPDSTDRPTIFEPLLILSYDSDTGFGYGAKAFLLNPFKIRESFDLILFNSTKGERWYRLVFSLPDFELRQGKAYPIAFDFIVDYDKYVARSFFGIGNNSSYEDREKYTRRDVEFSPTLTRGLTSRLIAQIGYRFKSIDSYNFDPEGSMKDIPPPQNITVITNHSFFLSFRYDSRNSYINPDSGRVFLVEVETTNGTTKYLRWAIWYQHYRAIFFRQTIFAFRMGLEALNGNDLPLQVLLPLGGNRSLRGYPQDRFLDKLRALINLEFRFSLIGNLGAIAGLDLGKVWPSLSSFNIENWAISPVLGLRYYFRTYIVRLDLGFSRETTGLYFNFGHIF